VDLHCRDALRIVSLIRRVVNATTGRRSTVTGGYVKRTPCTPHYDGVPADQPDPAVIAIFGLGPVDVQLVDSSQPSWRQV
jgi:hypothetical protein